MKCVSCGSEVSGKNFCTVCGHPVSESNNTASDVKSTGDISQKSKNVGLIVAVCVLVFALIVLVGISGFFIYRSAVLENAVNQSITSSGTTGTTPSPNQQNVPHFDRNSTYSSSYVYNNMNNIHNSYEADDSEANTLKEFVCEFNEAWVAYINSGYTDVFDYIKTGSQAYKYAIGYAENDIYEEYVLMDVNDVRRTSDTYYVWTHEIIKETSKNGVSVNKEYHWVYKVSYTNGGYYIENYISDPAYK